jgi:hypothetical protein
MEVDLHERAVSLLERLSNSVYDRLGHDVPLIHFTITEIQLVEQWIQESFMRE